ncbi:MAG: HAMP domain-containing protein [Chloroflexi bacterium]|jgi:two-component system, NtrC family, sensor kinase|nr:HAMP domain-containing protein [Chloroflexota bacterium]
MREFIIGILRGRLQILLIAVFSLLVGITVALGSLLVARVIESYLVNAQNERVARDMYLAQSFYQLELDEAVAACQRVLTDTELLQRFRAAQVGNAIARDYLVEKIARKISIPPLSGTHLIVLLDTHGEIVIARTVSADGKLSEPYSGGNWSELPIVASVLATGEGYGATEIISAELLDNIGLVEQAHVPLRDTPQSAPDLLFENEGTAGLTLTAAYPLHDADETLLGVVLVGYLFNNDFTLVDRIQDLAGVDTVTIFFGDMRVSTNVPDADGSRAVGTRISSEVGKSVLEQGQAYNGVAFVVNETYMTRYEPLHDHQGSVVGSLYVGARVASFEQLVKDFNDRVVLIIIICLALTAITAVPIAQIITRPIVRLVEANQRLAEGDMTVRVRAEGSSELATLGESFNIMVEKLDSAQQQLLHKEKLASLGQLAAGIAHELNNPLGTILLLADVLKKETPEDDPKREDLKVIIQETARCKNIVADLLNFSRQQELLTQDVYIPALVEQVLTSIYHQPAFEGIKIIQDFDAQIPAIQADPAQLQQVFINLLSNAADAIDGEGQIEISAQPTNGQWIEIKVSDSGCGISPEHLRKLFAPFFTTKALGKGTGLGLSIVYGIIKMHRGQIVAQSQEGVGTTFVITLPVQLPQAQWKKDYGS